MMNYYIKQITNVFLVLCLLALTNSKYATAGVYDECIPSYDFGNRTKAIFKLSAIGTACDVKCNNACSVFIKSGSATTPNDQAAKCLKMCRRGKSFSGFIFTEDNPKGDSINTNRRIIERYTVDASATCNEEDLQDNVHDTGIIRPLGSAVYIGLNKSNDNSSYPNLVNVIATCGFDDVVLDPVIKSNDYLEWSYNYKWFDGDTLTWAEHEEGVSNGSWLFGPQETGRSLEEIKAKHMCFAILTDDAIKLVTNQSLWGGYIIMGRNAFLGPTLWDNINHIKPEYRDPIYNYQKICNWHARNFYPTNTGFKVRNNDLFELSWTQLQNSGYRSLGAQPTSANERFTPSCISNGLLYRYYVNALNNVYDNSIPLLPPPVEHGCYTTLGTDLDLDAGTTTAPTPIIPEQPTLYDYSMDPEKLTGSDIAAMCESLKGYVYKSGHPKWEDNKFSKKSDARSYINNFKPSIGTTTSSSLFTPILTGRTMPQMRFLLGEGNQEYRYTYDYALTPDLSQSTYLEDNKIDGSLKLSNRKKNCGPDSATVEKSYAEDKIPPPTPPLFLYDILNATSSLPALHPDNAYLRNTSKNSANNPYCSVWDRDLYVGDFNTADDNTIIANTAPCIYQEDYEYMPHTDVGAFCADNNDDDRRKRYWPRRFFNFHCYLPNDYLFTHDNAAYRYKKCRGVDMPMIWDAHRKKMFFSTAVTDPESRFGQLLLPTLASQNILYTQNTAWAKPGEEWRSFNHSNGFKLMCKGLIDGAHDVQAAVINQNMGDMFFVVRNSAISLPFATGNQLHVPPSLYDKYFTNLTHHYDYLQAISIILNKIPNSFGNTNTNPHYDIIGILEENKVKIPVIQQETGCGSFFFNSSAYSALIQSRSMHDPISEWYLRSSINAYFGSEYTKPYSTALNPSACSLENTFLFTGALFDDNMFSLKLNNNSSNYKYRAENWRSLITNTYLGNDMHYDLIKTNNTNLDSILSHSSNKFLNDQSYYDYLYTIKGKLNNVSNTPVDFSVRHPIRYIGYSTNDRNLLWNQLGGTTVFARYTGCPKSVRDMDIEYKLVALNQYTGELGAVVKDWTKIPDNVLYGSDRLFFLSDNSLEAIAAQTENYVDEATMVKLLLRLKPMENLNYNLSCTGDNCAIDHFGHAHVSVRYTAPISFTPDTSSGSQEFSNFLGTQVNIVYHTLFGNNRTGDPGVVGKIFGSVINDNRIYGIVRALGVLYIAFTALAFMLGQLREPQMDIISRIVKLSIVLFITSPASFEFCLQLFKDISASSVSLIYGMLGNMLQDVDTSNKLATIDFSDNPGAVFIFLSGGWKATTSPQVWLKIWALCWSGYIGGIVALIVIIALIIFAVNIIKVMLSIMLSYITLGLLFCITPIMVCFMLFQTTQQLFDTWWKMIISMMITPALTFVTAALFNFLVLAALTSVLGFTACPACLFYLFTCWIPVFRPVIYSGVNDPTAVSMFYMPAGGLQVGLLLLIVVFSMYIFIDFISNVVTRMTAGGNLALLESGGAAIDQRMKNYLTGKDRGTQQKAAEGQKSKAADKNRDENHKLHDKNASNKRASANQSNTNANNKS